MFERATPSLTVKFQNKAIHGGNHAPSASDWFTGDDTLDRQGIMDGKSKGHGICKGVASSWVIAFINGVDEAASAGLYESYYTNFLRFQATMIKDAGKHINSHVASLSEMNVDPKIQHISTKDISIFSGSNIPNTSKRWGAYISVWGHDIAIGSDCGRSKNSFKNRSSDAFYINEPNTGLLGYERKNDFINDLNEYLAARRVKKNKSMNATGAFWFYKEK